MSRIFGMGFHTLYVERRGNGRFYDDGLGILARRGRKGWARWAGS